MALTYNSVDGNLSCEIGNFTLQFVTWFNTKMEMNAFEGTLNNVYVLITD